MSKSINDEVIRYNVALFLQKIIINAKLELVLWGFSQLSDFFDRTPNQPPYCKTEKVELLSKHSTKFPGCFKGFPKKIEGCLERVLMVFHGYFSSKVVSRKFRGCFKKVSRMFQGRFKSVSKEFKRWLLKD